MIFSLLLIALALWMYDHAFIHHETLLLYFEGQVTHMTKGLRWCSGQTTCLSLLRFRVRSPLRFTQSSCEKRLGIVNTLPKVVEFLRVLPFPPTGKVDRGG